MADVTLTCPYPGLDVGVPPYFVTVKAAKGAEGRQETTVETLKGSALHPVKAKTAKVRVGANIVDGKVTEPGQVKRLRFDGNGECTVPEEAFKAFNRNGAANSYGIRVKKSK